MYDIGSFSYSYFRAKETLGGEKYLKHGINSDEMTNNIFTESKMGENDPKSLPSRKRFLNSNNNILFYG